MSLFVDIRKKLGEFELNVSLESNGGISGLLGASGSGKSITLMCIAGIVKPDSGKIILNGTTLFDSEAHINLTPQQRHVGYLFQNYALFPNMTVNQNILCGLNREKSKTKKENLLLEMIELMQLKGLEKHKPGQLSGGQQQRVALARILIGNPSLLMLDEPFSALDSHLREQLRIDTQKLIEHFGKEALLVTHSRDEAYQMCSKIALIDSGKIIAHKNTKELFANPESRVAATLTGCKNVIDAKKTGQFSLYVPAWNQEFVTSEPIRDNLCAVGIRAHHFDPDTKENRYPIDIIEKTESPFEYKVQFRYKTQNNESLNIWWFNRKEKKTEEFSDGLGINQDDIMLLYK